MYVPPVYRVERLGRGRMTDRNASKLPPGSARDSLNLHHNREDQRAKTRDAIDRVWAARPGNSAVLTLYELIQSDGTSKCVAKVGTALYSFTYPTPAPSSFLTGMHATHQAQIASAANRMFIADRAKNYLSDGTSAGTIELQKAAVNGTFSGASSGTATGNVAATITYWFTDVAPTHILMECPPGNTTVSGGPGTKITVARSADAGVNLSGFTYSGDYTRKHIYRNRPGDPQPYYVTSIDSPINTIQDLSLDTSLDTVSTVHDENGVPSIEKPEAAQHVTEHRGRAFLANLDGATSDLRWSRILEFTQFENYDEARRSIKKNDGTEITGIVSWRGSLVIFKNRSIYVMNGSDDQARFEVQPMVLGVGARAPRSIVATENDILFLSESDGVYAFNLRDGIRRVSMPIDGDFASLAWSLTDAFCAGYDRVNKQYLISVAPYGVTTNTKTHVLNLDTGAWGRFEFGMGVIKPTCYGEMRNAAGELSLYLGSTNGYAYEMNTSTGADGVTSGTKTGAVTSSADTTHVTVSGATFLNTDDKLKGLSATLVTTAGDVETREIDTNSGTEITVTSAFTVTRVGSTLYIGAIQAMLHLNRVDFGAPGYKATSYIDVLWEKQTHTIPLQVGYTKDGDTAPTAKTSLRMDGGYRGRAPAFDRCVGVSLYFNIVGTDAPFDILSAHMPYRLLDTGFPAR